MGGRSTLSLMSDPRVRRGRKAAKQATVTATATSTAAAPAGALKPRTTSHSPPALAPSGPRSGSGAAPSPLPLPLPLPRAAFPFHLYLHCQSAAPSRAPRSSQTDPWTAEERPLSFLPPAAASDTADAATDTGVELCDSQCGEAALDAGDCWSEAADGLVQRLLSPLLSAACEEVRFEQRREAAQSLMRRLQGRLETERRRVAEMEAAEVRREQQRTVVLIQARAARVALNDEAQRQRMEAQRRSELTQEEAALGAMAAAKAQLQQMEDMRRLLQEEMVSAGCLARLNELHRAREALGAAVGRGTEGSGVSLSV